MADTTVTINVVDRSVPPLRAINIAVINQPNPVTGYSATGQEVWDLIQISKYFITDEDGTPIDGSNFYDYFPDMAPGGGGGGTVDAVMSLESENPVQNKVITGTIDSLDNSFSAISSTTIDTIWNDTSNS